jgi:hypothetical protein
MPEMSRSWWSKLSGVLRSPTRVDDNGTSAAVHRFRAEVDAAVAGAPDRALLTALLTRPAALGLPGDELELEIEVIEGALDLLTLQERVAEGGLPVVPHQHKALGDERCHFAAAAFLASDASQRTGRLFLTDRRLVFLAAPLVTLPWGAIARIDEEGRDVIVTAPGRGAFHRFRCNSYSDARCGRWIGEILQSQKSEVKSQK